MSRKDYELIAAAIKSQVAGHERDAATKQVANAIALARDNPRFDTAKFLKACGFSELIMLELVAIVMLFHYGWIKLALAWITLDILILVFGKGE